MMPELNWIDDCELSEAGAEWLGGDNEFSERRGMRCDFSTHNVEDLLELLDRNTEWVVALSQLPVLKIIASELFLGNIDVEFESDPEIEGCHYVTFSVTVFGDLSDVTSLRSEWYRRTEKILGDNCDKVRLIISLGP